MSTALDSSLQRRAELIARSDALRRQLSQHHRAWGAQLQSVSRRVEGPVRAAGMVAGLAGQLRQNPLLVTVLGFALMKTPWRTLAHVPKLAWRGWKILRFVRGLAG